LRRAARLADGWHGIRMTPAQIADVRQELGLLLRKQGRLDMDSFQISLRAGLDITTDNLAEPRLPLRGSPAQVAADVAQYRDAGLDYLVVEPRAANVPDFSRQMQHFSQEVWTLL